MAALTALTEAAAGSAATGDATERRTRNEAADLVLEHCRSATRQLTPPRNVAPAPRARRATVRSLTGACHAADLRGRRVAEHLHTHRTGECAQAQMQATAAAWGDKGPNSSCCVGCAPVQLVKVVVHLRARCPHCRKARPAAAGGEHTATAGVPQLTTLILVRCRIAHRSNWYLPPIGGSRRGSSRTARIRSKTKKNEKKACRGEKIGYAGGS